MPPARSGNLPPPSLADTGEEATTLKDRLVRENWLLLSPGVVNLLIAKKWSFR
jgi:hypothetical protein